MGVVGGGQVCPLGTQESCIGQPLGSMPPGHWVDSGPHWVGQDAMQGDPSFPVIGKYVGMQLPSPTHPALTTGPEHCMYPGPHEGLQGGWHASRLVDMGMHMFGIGHPLPSYPPLQTLSFGLHMTAHWASHCVGMAAGAGAGAGALPGTAGGSMGGIPLAFMHEPIIGQLFQSRPPGQDLRPGPH